MKHLTFSVLAFAIFLSPLALNAETLSFSKVWKKIEIQAPSIEATKFDQRAADEAMSRSGRHWLPKVYAEARTYQTTDPGASFFGILEQRKLESADFNTSSMNSSQTRQFTRGTLGVDFAFYEGGMRNAGKEAAEHISAAKKLAASQSEIDLYARTAGAYGSVIVLTSQIETLRSLDDELSRVLKNYRIGDRSNPVGYSGFLGLKALKNKLAGLEKRLAAERIGAMDVLRELGLNTYEWTPENIAVADFVSLYLPISRAEKGSYSLQAMKQAAKASESLIGIESGKVRPVVGAFAETSIFSGERATAGESTAGLYLKWSIFNPDDFGSSREARFRAAADSHRAENFAREERAEYESLIELQKSMIESDSLMNDSAKLLVEQWKTAETLFKNGSISALQIVEILDRRSDLIEKQTELKQMLIKTAGRLALKNTMVIESKVGGGR